MHNMLISHSPSPALSLSIYANFQKGFQYDILIEKSHTQTQKSLINIDGVYSFQWRTASEWPSGRERKVESAN